jgi:hypothetical protein
MDERLKFIMKHSAQRNVTHIGCADVPYTERRINDGRLLHKNLIDITNDIVGIDISTEGLKILSKNYPTHKFCLPEEYNNLGFSPDLILAGEVIEHVDNPSSFLNYINSISSSNTRLLITTPNAYSIKGFLRAILGREYCHPDHVLHFSEMTLKNLLIKHGWKIDIVDFYFSTPTTFLGNLTAPIFCLIRRATSKKIGDGIMLIASKI